MAVQAYQPPQVRRYWLAVLIRNLAEGAFLVANSFAEVWMCFWTHFTASSVPVPLRASLRQAVDSFADKFSANSFHALLWILGSDSAMARLPSQSVNAAMAPTGAGLQSMRASMLSHVHVAAVNVVHPMRNAPRVWPLHECALNS